MSSHEESTLFEFLPIGAYRSAPDGTLLRINTALLRLNGYATEAEFRADTKNTARDPYVAPGRRRQFMDLLSSQGQVRNFESEMVRFNAPETMWVREHAHVVRDPQGEVLYFEGTIEDITEERSATARLEQSEAILQSILHTIPDQVWLKDVDGVYLACNDQFASNMGTKAVTVVGTTDAAWVSAELEQQFIDADRRAIQWGKAMHYQEALITTSNPQGDWFEVSRIPVRDGEGHTIGVLGIARNIQERRDAESQLRDASEQLELVMMGADLGRWDHDLTQEKGYRLDARACQILGRPAHEATQYRAWGHLIHPDDLPGTLRAMRSHLGGNTRAYEAEYRARHTDGRWIWLASRGKVVQTGQDEQPLRMVGTIMDISARKQAEIKLRATQAELQATLNAIPDLLIEFSADGHYRAIHSHTGTDLIAPIEEQIGKTLHQVINLEAADTCMAALREALEVGHSFGKQYWVDGPNGKIWFELSAVRKPTEPGDEQRLIAVARNITERKMAEESIRHLAFHDSLTDLPNRRLLGDRLQQAVTASARQQQYGALLFLDLDRFKQLNDTQGHEVGDLLLKEVAQRLKLCVRAIDTVARLGGDEFVVLIQDLSTEPDAARLHATTVGHKILASLNEPYTLGGLEASTTPSIGITLFQGNVVPPAEILKQADMAMYQAKAEGRNTLCFYAQNTA
ncbi:sensor domain-containing diguanylate cyclase [Rhodoferax saidenbachensis]|uniref:sensor domain-containing diguanylate cyclase n=1 Tax=Rhodoferax saidenbachensis TaxID=1484693 RepID=UPI001267B21E|nr:sensor domain-containing diguanylate cyclase [Rhodoferax saidenbachensis]